jgi:hypothetical protein
VVLVKRRHHRWLFNPEKHTVGDRASRHHTKRLEVVQFESAVPRVA